MRIVYMGSPDFAVAPMKALIDAGHDVVLCVSQPDRPKGRKKQLTPTAVKQAALDLGIEVITPQNVNEQSVVDQIAAAKPELMVVTAFGQLLKKPLLEMAPLGAVNIHASLLPKYRGAAPIQCAIANGEKVTGVTTMFMDIGMDTGDMIMSAELAIEPDDNTATLHEKLSAIGADLILKTVDALAAGNCPRTPQNNDEATYAPKILREQERINWQDSAENIANLVRALAPWVGAYSTYDEKNVKIWRAYAVSGVSAEPGIVCDADKEGITVACGTGALKILRLQPAGKQEMAATDFWRGQHNKALNWR